MKFVVTRKFENKLTNRIEVYGYIEEYEGTINRKEALELLSKEFNWNKDLIIIRKIETKKGSNKNYIEAHLYTNEKSLKYFEPSYILRRHGKTEEDKKEGKEKASQEAN